MKKATRKTRPITKVIERVTQYCDLDKHAAMLGVTPRYLRGVLSGKNNPSKKLAARIKLIKIRKKTRAVVRFKGGSALAKQLDISPSHLTYILQGKRRAGSKLAELMKKTGINI